MTILTASMSGLHLHFKPKRLRQETQKNTPVHKTGVRVRMFLRSSSRTLAGSHFSLCTFQTNCSVKARCIAPVSRLIKTWGQCAWLGPKVHPITVFRVPPPVFSTTCFLRGSSPRRTHEIHHQDFLRHSTWKGGQRLFFSFFLCFWRLVSFNFLVTVVMMSHVLDTNPPPSESNRQGHAWSASWERHEREQLAVHH